MSTAHQAIPVGRAEAQPMEKIEDYNELNKLKKRDGRKVHVLYSDLIYRVINGEWTLVGKVDPEGNVIYRRKT